MSSQTISSNSASAVQSGVNSALSIYQTFQNLKSVKNYTNTQIANLANITEGLENSTNTLYAKYKQQEELMAYQLEQATLANMKAKGTAQASAASSGVAGNSINNLFRGYDRAIAVDNYIAARNLQNQRIQYTNEIEGLRANAINAINNLGTFNYQSSVSGLDLSFLKGLQIGTSNKKTGITSTPTDGSTGTLIDTVYVTGGLA